MTVTDGAKLALESWRFVRQMLDDLTETIETDAETEMELLEGLRVLGRITALCSELSLDVDTDAPWFFGMNTEARLIGGRNPDGEYFLAMIDGRHRYRVRGHRGTTAYLGFQVLAGVGLTPRRMGAYLSDRDLQVADVRFDRSDGAERGIGRVGAESLGERSDFNRIAERGARSVGFDKADCSRVDARYGQCFLRDGGHAFLAGGQITDLVRAVVIDG